MFCVVYSYICLLCVRCCNSFIIVFALQNLALQVSGQVNAFITHHGHIRPFGNGLLHIISSKNSSEQAEFNNNSPKIQKFLCHYTETHHATSQQTPAISSSTNSIALTSATSIPMFIAASTSHGHIKGEKCKLFVCLLVFVFYFHKRLFILVMKVHYRYKLKEFSSGEAQLQRLSLFHRLIIYCVWNNVYNLAKFFRMSE